MELEKTAFNLKQLISDIKKANQVKAEEKENFIKLMIDDDVPSLLIGDSLRLGQIISNLVSNAVKFTKNGIIIVELTLQKRNGNTAVLGFSVTDSGIGIEPAKQGLIFERFTQANSETTREFGGTGLGLVITKKPLQLHGSEIKLFNKTGKGTKFYFSVELEIALPSLQTPKEKNLSEPHQNDILEGVKVLLVEDYPVNIKVATKFLALWKKNIDVAENGKFALEKFEIGKYDVILMDIQMPIMDGYTATAEIRKLIQVCQLLP